MGLETISRLKYIIMKRFVLLIAVLLAWGSCFGQSKKKETLGISGSSAFIYANNKSYFLQQSIGQGSVINTYQGSNYELRQGFLQPLKAALINTGFDTEIDVLVYPNLFSETVNLAFEEPLIDQIKIALYHISGQLVYQETFNPSETLTLQFLNLPIGTYVLRGQMRSQTFVAKLIKH